MYVLLTRQILNSHFFRRLDMSDLQLGSTGSVMEVGSIELQDVQYAFRDIAVHHGFGRRAQGNPPPESRQRDR